jgi:hypothetical protein
MRRNSTRSAPSSTTAMFIFQSSCVALASHASAIFFAVARSTASAAPAASSVPSAAVSAIGLIVIGVLPRLEH